MKDIDQYLRDLADEMSEVVAAPHWETDPWDPSKLDPTLEQVIQSDIAGDADDDWLIEETILHLMRHNWTRDEALKQTRTHLLDERTGRVRSKGAWQTVTDKQAMVVISNYIDKTKAHFANGWPERTDSYWHLSSDWEDVVVQLGSTNPCSECSIALSCRECPYHKSGQDEH